MGTTITIEFEDDLSEADVKIIQDKINMVLDGKPVPEPEVEGQRPPLPRKFVNPRTPRPGQP